MTAPTEAPDASRMACRGSDVIVSVNGEMIECIECGRGVRWDLTEHAFFGFAAACGRGSDEYIG